MTPEQQHRYGLEELERIRTELEKLESSASPGLHPIPPSGGASLLRRFQAARRKAQAGLPRLFAGRLTVPLELDPVDAPGRGGPDAAWYTPPSMDGETPATLHFRAGRSGCPLRWVETLFLREGVPGRHLLVDACRRMENSPGFIHYGYQEAFVEGWALYAESLGEALGMYRSRESRRGRLELDRLRTARLVLETGIHWRRWSSRKAVEFLQSMFGNRAAMELERCVARPGHAAVPKLAERTFLELRAEAEEGLGGRFDLPWFHHELLHHGPIPLPLLRGRVLAAVEARLRADPEDRSVRSDRGDPLDLHQQLFPTEVGLR